MRTGRGADGPVEPAGTVGCVEKSGDSVVVTVTGAKDDHYVRTTVSPIREPPRQPLELTRDQIADFPVLRTGLAYFDYDYDETNVKASGDELGFQSWLDSYRENRRNLDVVPQNRPFRLGDAVFSVGVQWFS